MTYKCMLYGVDEELHDAAERIWDLLSHLARSLSVSEFVDVLAIDLDSDMRYGVLMIHCYEHPLVLHAYMPIGFSPVKLDLL